MNAPATSIAPDRLATLLPGRSEAELRLRRRMHTARDVGGARMVALQSPAAKDLNHLMIEAVNAWLFAPATIETLQAKVNWLLRLALLTSEAERLYHHG
jgi:hypothetical protein